MAGNMWWPQSGQARGAGCTAHHVAVAVLDAADDLLEEVPRLILQEATLLDDVVEELARLPGSASQVSGTYGQLCGGPPYLVDWVRIALRRDDNGIALC